jgi:hypothetical protein
MPQITIPAALASSLQKAIDTWDEFKGDLPVGRQEKPGDIGTLAVQILEDRASQFRAMLHRARIQQAGDLGRLSPQQFEQIKKM